MRFALRPYLIAGVAIAGAGAIIMLAPAAPPLPDVQVPAVQPAGSEQSDINLHDLLGLLGGTDGTVLAPDKVPGPSDVVPSPNAVPSPNSEGLSPPAGLPDLGKFLDPALNPAIAPPGPGRLDLNGLGVGPAPNPSNVPGSISSDVPAGR
jgi:hypothetical protein